MSKKIADKVTNLRYGIDEALIELFQKGIERFIHQAVMDSDEVKTVIADTNADDWVVDDFQVESIVFPTKRAIIVINWTAYGDQKEDKTFAGDRIKGTLILNVYQDRCDIAGITAELEDYNEPEYPDDMPDDMPDDEPDDEEDGK